MTKVFSKNKNFLHDYAHHPTEIRSILEGVYNVNQKENHQCFEPIDIKGNFSKKEFCF